MHTYTHTHTHTHGPLLSPVHQVTWSGSTHPLCHVGPGTGGNMMLAGATADALMFLRFGEWGLDDREIVYRPVNLVQAMVGVGWHVDDTTVVFWTGLPTLLCAGLH